MSILIIPVVLVCLAVGFLSGRLLAPRPKLDGDLVITQEGDKIKAVFEFYEEDTPTLIWNQKYCVFKVVGPKRIKS